MNPVHVVPQRRSRRYAAQVAAAQPQLSSLEIPSGVLRDVTDSVTRSSAQSGAASRPLAWSRILTILAIAMTLLGAYLLGSGVLK